jgi:AraC-like DNA-binding protein
MVLSTQDLPPAERFGCWLELVCQSYAPYRIQSEHEDNFTARLDVAQLGQAYLIRQAQPSLEAHRDSVLIRREDPEFYTFGLNIRGHVQMTQNRRTVLVGPGELVMHDTSRPFRCVVRGESFRGGDRHTGISFSFPRRLLPLPERTARQLILTALPGRAGFGRLIWRHLAELSRDQTYPSAEAGRLGIVTVDLIAALFAHHLEAEAALPAPTYQRALLTRVYAFIDGNLANPNLDAEVLAAAHGVSVRHLHRLFASQGTTVASWIRARRLERCRRDLIDPGLRDRTVQAIGARWGLVNPTHFSRAFRAAYGHSPRQYRQRYTLTAP